MTQITLIDPLEVERCKSEIANRATRMGLDFDSSDIIAVETHGNVIVWLRYFWVWEEEEVTQEDGTVARVLQRVKRPVMWQEFGPLDFQVKSEGDKLIYTADRSYHVRCRMPDLVMWPVKAPV